MDRKTPSRSACLREWRKKRKEAGTWPKAPSRATEGWREYQRKWRKDRPGLASKYSKRWRDKQDPETIREKQRQYYEKHREKARLYAEQRRRARGVKPMKRGKMSRTEESRVYRSRHPEQTKEAERRRRENNREAYNRRGRINTGRRRIRKAGLPGSHAQEQWLALCRKFKWRCVCCGVHDSVSTLARDHIIPITNPLSTDDISNIQPLCQPCNSSKGNKHTIDYRKTPFQRRGQAVML